jgi:DNA polymerase I
VSTHLLVDGNALACWHWWANASDAPRRFAETIARLSREHEAMASVCWDAPPPTWRRELFPGYKSNRPPKPEALIEALRECRRMPGIAYYQAPGFEADDVIATLAEKALEFGSDDEVLILSGDKDFAQLVNDRCRMLSFIGKVIDEAAVEERWGVPPSAMRLLLSWCGDTADGLPGVKGYGPKKSIAHALAGEVGDPLTYELVGLAIVPDSLLEKR